MKEKIIEAMNTGYYKDNDYKIIKMKKDEVILEYELKENGKNPYGMIHGATLFGVCDNAAALLACMSGKMPITISSTINYLTAAYTKKVVAHATPLKVGNNVAYYEVKLYDEKKTLLVTCNVDMYLKKYDE